MGSVLFLIVVVVVFVFLCGGILRIASIISLSDHNLFFWRILIQKYMENKLSLISNSWKIIESLDYKTFKF